MKVLFVSSGNSEFGISPLVKGQGDRLAYFDHNIEYYKIVGKGLVGYCRNIFPLRSKTKTRFYDIIHAHYSLSAFVASIAGCRPLVVSLMGSDVNSGKLYIFIIKLFRFLFRWKAIVVKSEEMYKALKINSVTIIPNGVDLSEFKVINSNDCRIRLNWNIYKKHILFGANPNRKEKNYELFNQAISCLQTNDVNVHVLENVPHEEIPYYLNAAHVVVLTSLWEGSPNIIKEAMACNRPIVTTKVGDVEWLLEGVEGCFISDFNSIEISKNIVSALEFVNHNLITRGREKLIKLGLDADDIARRLIAIYQNVSN